LSIAFIYSPLRAHFSAVEVKWGTYIIVAPNLKRKYLHQPIANSYHPSASKELLVSSVHSIQQVLRGRHCCGVASDRKSTVDMG
jgi:hypothetical protein